MHVAGDVNRWILSQDSKNHLSHDQNPKPGPNVVYQNHVSNQIGSEGLHLLPESVLSQWLNCRSLKMFHMLDLPMNHGSKPIRSHFRVVVGEFTHVRTCFRKWGIESDAHWGVRNLDFDPWPFKH